jgi:putative endonuclease
LDYYYYLKGGIMHNKAKGDMAEKTAADFLKLKGYVILEVKFSCQTGEIDIIAREKNTLVFVEVKMRSNEKFGLPREAVGKKKQETIKKVALIYLSENTFGSMDCRFDVIEVIFSAKNDTEGCIREKSSLYEITHIENAFW